MRRIAPIARATVVVLGAAALSLTAGALLPAQPALVVAVAAVVVLPGWALATGIGLSARFDRLAVIAVAPVVGLMAWIPPLAVGFAAGLQFDVVLALLALETAGLLAISRPFAVPTRRLDAGIAAVAGLACALASIQWQETLRGDLIFHLARVRKLLAVPDLSLSAMSEMAGGHPHAGYAFPLLHAVQAGALRLAGLDATEGYTDLVPAMAVLVGVTAFAAGRALGGTAVGAAVAALTLWATMTGTRPTLGELPWPGRFVFLIVFPATLLAIIELIRTPADRRLQAVVSGGALVVAIVHVSYAVPLLALMAGAVAVSRRAWAGFLGMVIATAGVAAFVWWVALHGYPEPVIGEGRWQRATSDAFVFVAGHPVSLNAQTITEHRVGTLITVAAIIPLLVWRAPKLAFPAALAAGVLCLVAIPGLAPVLNATVGVGQTHRFGDAIPWPFVVAFLAALAVKEATRRWIVPVGVFLAVMAAIGPDRVKSFWDVAPSVPTTPVAVAAVLAAGWYLVRGVRALPPSPVQVMVIPTVLVAIALVALPDPSAIRTVSKNLVHGRPVGESVGMPAELVDWIDQHGGTMPTVLSDELRSYRLGAHADVYVVAVPEVRTRANPASNPEERRQDVRRFLAAATPEAERLAIIDKYAVDIVIAPAEHEALIDQLGADPRLQERLVVPSARGGYVIFSVR
ncbi:MAG: hypothetical protein QOJ13_3108 [Gaiellales bacterium]|nr:hypothetical protein [Gaiellales bacterium]